MNNGESSFGPKSARDWNIVVLFLLLFFFCNEYNLKIIEIYFYGVIRTIKRK